MLIILVDRKRLISHIDLNLSSFFIDFFKNVFNTILRAY